MIKVLLDTNIPLLLYDGGFNLQSELKRLLPQDHQLVFLSASERELQYIASRGRKLARKVSFAKKFLETITVVEYDPPEIETVDEIIINYAVDEKNTCIIVTNDKDLRRRSRKKKIPVIFIRTRRHLVLDGSLENNPT
jgi:hypothetical protein